MPLTKKTANSWLLLYCRPNQKTLINWRAAKLLFKFLLCLSKENNFQDHRSHTKMIAIVVFCPVKFVEEPTATRVAFVASVRVSAGERAKSDRVKIGTRVRASDGRTLARSSKKIQIGFTDFLFFLLSSQFLHDQNRKSSLFVRVQLLRRLQHMKIYQNKR